MKLTGTNYILVSALALVSFNLFGCRGMIRESQNKNKKTSPTATPGVCDGTIVDPVLRTKKIAGNPGATINLDFDGDVSQLKVVFLDSAHSVVAAPTPASNGDVTLPTRAGIYRVALTNTCNGKVSYAQATVNSSFAGFTADSNVISFAYGAFPMWPESSVAVSDFDGDGDLDFAQAGGGDGMGGNVSGGIKVYLYDSNTNQFAFALDLPEPGAFSPTHVNAGDFNEDGFMDLIWNLSGDPDMRIALGNGDGTFQTPVNIPYPTAATAGTLYTYEMATADLDRDGHLDIVVGSGVYDGVAWNSGNSSRAIVLMRGLGNGNFVTSILEETVGVDYPFISLAIADADDDGRLDIYAMTGDWGNTSMRRLIQQSNGSYSMSTLGTDYYTDPMPHGGYGGNPPTVAYVNGDTKPDVVVIHVDGPSTYFESNASDMTYVTTQLPGFTEQHGARSTLADLDVDGEMELYMPLKNRLHFIGAGYDDHAGILRQNASEFGTIGATDAAHAIPGYSTFFGWSNASAFFDDYNGDGKIDILVPIAAESKIETIFAN